MTEEETQNITGQKRAWEPGGPPEGPPPGADGAVAPEAPMVVGDTAPTEDTPVGEVAAPEGEAAPMTVEPTTEAPPTAGTPANGAASGEEQQLQGEAAWLRQQNTQLQTQLRSTMPPPPRSITST